MSWYYESCRNIFWKHKGNKYKNASTENSSTHFFLVWHGAWWLELETKTTLWIIIKSTNVQGNYYMPGRSCNALITKISQSTLGLRENELSRETVNYGGVSNMVYEIRQSSIICWVDGTIVSSTKRLMFQALFFFHNFLQNSLQKNPFDLFLQK